MITFSKLRNKRNARQTTKSRTKRSKDRPKNRDGETHRTKRQASIIKDVYDGEAVGKKPFLFFNLNDFNL